MKDRRNRIAGAVSSSEASTRLLQENRHRGPLAQRHRRPLALCGRGRRGDPAPRPHQGRRRRVAGKDRRGGQPRFVCIVDDTRVVDVLGGFPSPSRSFRWPARWSRASLPASAGSPSCTGFRTDNGNGILDVHNLKITDPTALEAQIRLLVGVVEVGLFARRGAMCCSSRATTASRHSSADGDGACDPAFGRHRDGSVACWPRSPVRRLRVADATFL